MAPINDLNVKNWAECQDILTDSLWLIGERDKSGSHKGDYHGNFVPQIPNQLIRRFTKKGDTVLDAFLGSGTTLIECKRLGRNGIGIELLPEIANLAQQRLNQESLFDQKGKTSIIIGDSTKKTSRDLVIKNLESLGQDKLQLIVLHPPYHDIIKFSNRPEDLSNTATVEDFLKLYGDVVSNFLDLLEKRHFLAVVIGDKYTNSQWVPLGFQTMQETMNRGGNEIILKSILIKNMVNNRAKRNMEKLWRYRALVGGFYIFRHEYILLFQKI